MTLTPEQIAAFADGELEGAELAQAEQAVANDEALAAEVAQHRALKAQLGAHFAPVLDQPVPDHLAAMLKSGSDTQQGEVISLGAARQKRGLAPFVRRWVPIGGSAIAAALIAAIVLPGSGSNTPADGYAGTQLAAALDTQLVASQDSQADTRILLSFENGAGQLCRTYRGQGAGGIACRDDNGWKIETEMGLDGTQSTEFRQAGSEAGLMAAAQDMAAGGALDADQEAEAKARGWR